MAANHAVPTNFGTAFPPLGSGSNIEQDISSGRSVSGNALKYPEEIPQAALAAVSLIVENECKQQNLNFMRCKSQDEDPQKCLDEGRESTLCVLDIFKQAHRSPSTRTALDAYSLCLEMSSLSFWRCRNEEKNFYDEFFKGKEPKHHKWQIGPSKKY